jgi:ABC-type antimicrobial peptide transport system permease subunit
LVVTQLVISQILVICTLFVSSQLSYFIDAPIGLDKEAVIEFPLPNGGKENVDLLANFLINNPSLASVTFSSTGATSDDAWGGSFEFDNGKEVIDKSTLVKYIDENFIETYGIKLEAGKNLIKADSATMFLVNESFVTAMGLKDNLQAVGQYVKFWGIEAPIAGVLKNFNTTSLHTPIKACVFLVGADSYFKGAVKVTGNNMEQEIASIEKSWLAVYPDNIFEFHFLDETIARFYAEEKKLSQLVKIFVSLAIVIGAMGLFGLISFVAKRRTKEVGVRKVLGATVTNVVMLLSRHFMMLTLIAFLIAAPISYYVMDSWLENFSYRIDLDIGTFLTGAVISLAIVGLTVSYRTIKAALANPVEALKYE